jgi:hypothetical protein
VAWHTWVQEHLEKNTEHLAELSEMPLLKINRTEVVNFTRVTQKVRVDRGGRGNGDALAIAQAHLLQTLFGCVLCMGVGMCAVHLLFVVCSCSLWPNYWRESRMV